jgi:hypothetical protein
MKKILLVIFCLLWTNLLSAQSNHYSKQIIEQGTKMANALVHKQYDSLLNFMHPRVVELSGGKVKIKEILDKQFSNGEVQLTRATIGEPLEIFILGNEYQCVLPQIIDIKVEGGKLIAKSFLIAFSKDKGKNWFFVDTAPGLDNLKKVINISSKIIIPEKEEPLFFPN